MKIELTFSTANCQGREEPALSPIDPMALMESLAERGVMTFEIRWENLGLCALPVEDDIVFLCDAVSDLPQFLAGAEHFVYLGNGSLVISAVRSNESVSIHTRRSPHLHRDLTTDHHTNVPVDAYVLAWNRLMEQLCHLAGSLGVAVH
ncbi:hypothetical protein [Labilithrix luteola]|uniref:hypothetical protein n=1 Tax=Labilithrix luteola TaxID=1391654 RepID=UPI0011BA7560|nr:hypothetical protein [Labilithrix luteola]